MRVWQTQPAAFFDDAIIDADGTLAETTDQCKAGMDIAYNGVWAYHPLVLSLAQTQEPLLLENRSGNRTMALCPVEWKPFVGGANGWRCRARSPGLDDFGKSIRQVVHS